MCLEQHSPPLHRALSSPQKDQTNLRRPPCSTLYDVFSNIRDDEEQHVLTMQACEACSIELWQCIQTSHPSHQFAETKPS
eukprot:6458989-Amphidinium_carterae.1